MWLSACTTAGALVLAGRIGGSGAIADAVAAAKEALKLIVSKQLTGSAIGTSLCQEVALK